jgi:hypothetical protein
MATGNPSQKTWLPSLTNTAVNVVEIGSIVPAHGLGGFVIVSWKEDITRWVRWLGIGHLSPPDFWFRISFCHELATNAVLVLVKPPWPDDIPLSAQRWRIMTCTEMMRRMLIAPRGTSCVLSIENDDRYHPKSVAQLWILPPASGVIPTERHNHIL